LIAFHRLFVIPGEFHPPRAFQDQCRQEGRPAVVDRTGTCGIVDPTGLFEETAAGPN
jgi:hypothetical protein